LQEEKYELRNAISAADVAANAGAKTDGNVSASFSIA
jgi:hypothetical protein